MPESPAPTLAPLRSSASRSRPRGLPSRAPRYALALPLVAAACVLLPAGAGAQAVDQAVQTRSQANAEGTKSQARINELADQTDTLLARYRAALDQTESLSRYNRQMDRLIAAQQTEMDSLRGQIDDISIVARGVTPLMLEMLDALEAFVDLDVPFLPEERAERIALLRETMGRSDVSNAEKYRRLLEAYQIENDYGRTIEAYRGEIASGKTVDFLRMGRIALVYQTLDGQEAGAWDKESKSFVPIDSGYRSAIKEGLRIARKQAPPDLVRLPLPAAKRATPESDS